MMIETWEVKASLGMGGKMRANYKLLLLRDHDMTAKD